jgi:diguanylate cyclase (GGDEF)-like protein
MAALLEALLHPVLLVDGRSLRIAAANDRAALLIGCPASGLVGQPIERYATTPEDAAFWAEAAAGSATEIESETLLGLADGSVVPVTRRVQRIAGDGGAAQFVVALQDRSAEQESRQRLELALAELQATLESTADGILVTDLAGRVRQCNRRFAALWDLPDALLERRDDDALHDWMRGRVIDPMRYMRRLAETDDARALPATDLIELQSGRTLERVIHPLASRDRCIGRVYSFRDVSERLAARAQIEQLVGCDLLTGLPNRQRLADRIELALALGRRDAMPFAVLIVNLDRFKPVNESLGHAAGDRVLAEAAARIQRALRQADQVARLNADEFALLLPSADARGAQTTAQRVLEALKEPHRHGDTVFTVTASIGIALYPGDGASVDELLASADAAVRDAKDGGRAAIRLHRELRGTDNAALQAITLDHAMRQALTQGRFRLHFQPQVTLADGAVHGAEALIRWRDPERGDIPPGDFIPAAEASGLIVPIGDWVLRQAVQQAAAWRQQGRALRVAVNVSALQFRQPGFVDGVAAALRQARLPGEWLEMELTESILLRDANDALQRLAALAALGVQLAIDDFGTGYSSLGYLKRLPISRLKIDRSFVRGLPEDSSDAGIVRAVVQMGASLGLGVVAEGVETEAQRRFLLDAGCHAFQGFLVAPALPAAALEELLDRRKLMAEA